MSLDEIKRRKAETREDRDKKHEQAIKEIKDRKVKELQAKKAEKAKFAKVAAPSKAVSKQQNAAPKAKTATAARGKKWSVKYSLIRSKSCCKSVYLSSKCEEYPVSQKERYGMLPMVEIKLSKSFLAFCYLLAVSQFFYIIGALVATHSFNSF